MNIKTGLQWGVEKLKKTDSPHLDAEILLSFVTKKSREYLFTYPEKKITKDQEKKYKNFIEQRSKYEPIAYIIGYKEFYNLKFLINKKVLIPRPETELLIDIAKEYISQQKKVNTATLVDIGLGSGTIAITLKKLFPKLMVFATETSAPTISLAKKNAKNLKTKIIIKKGDLLTPIKKDFNKYYNNLIITANLPYLSIKEWQEARPNVKLYEPKNALVGGKYGHELYEKLFKQISGQIKNKKKYNITLFIEIGNLQKNKITELIKQYFKTKKFKFYKDLSGKWRVCKIEL